MPLSGFGFGPQILLSSKTAVPRHFASLWGLIAFESNVAGPAKLFESMNHQLTWPGSKTCCWLPAFRGLDVGKHEHWLRFAAVGLALSGHVCSVAQGPKASQLQLRRLPVPIFMRRLYNILINYTTNDIQITNRSPSTQFYVPRCMVTVSANHAAG